MNNKQFVVKNKHVVNNKQSVVKNKQNIETFINILSPKHSAEAAEAWRAVADLDAIDLEGEPSLQSLRMIVAHSSSYGLLP